MTILVADTIAQSPQFAPFESASCGASKHIRSDEKNGVLTLERDVDTTA
jgi:hypothetical protein